MASDELVQPDPRPPRALAWGITVGFLALIAGVALIDAVWPAPPIRLVGAEQQRAHRAARSRSPWDGSLARWLESGHEQRSRTKRAVVPWWSALILRYAPQSHGDLVVGRDVWLFLRERVEPPKQSTDELVTSGVHALSAISRTLASHGYRLIVMPVPRKSVVCSARLPKGLDPRPDIDYRTLALLGENGVVTLDLLEAWRGHDPDTLYMSHDTHWQFEGRRLASEAFAAQFPALVGDRYDVQVRQQESPARVADLLNYAGIPALHPASAWVGLGPAIDTRLEPSALHDRVRDHRGLADLLVVGTSFTVSNDFPRLLFAALRDDLMASGFAGAEFIEPLTRVAVPLGGAPGEGPEWILYEFPLHQVWNLATRWSPAHGMFGKFFMHLPTRELHSLAVPDALVRIQQFGDDTVARAVPGAVYTTGEGLVHLRLQAADVAEVEGTEWTFESSGSQFQFTWPAGRKDIALPWIEGPEATGEWILRGRVQRALMARVEAELATDLDLSQAVPLTATELAAGGALLACAGLRVPRGGALLLRCAVDGASHGRAEVRVQTADGREHVHALPARGGSLLVVGLGGLAGAELAAIEVHGAALESARLAPADWPEVD